MHITTDLVKELRLKSGIGIMECKKALIAAHGDIKKAIIILKKNGQIKAENKITNIASRGVVATYVIKNKYAYMIELNCETDFVEKHPDFLNFSSEALLYIHKNKIKDISILQALLEEKRIMLVSKFGENILIRRFCFIVGNYIECYVHRNKIGVLVQSNSKKVDVIKKVAMHIAANNPDYLSRHDIPDAIIEKERNIQSEITARLGKPLSIAKKIVNGQIEKFIDNICLLEQNCVFEVNQKIKDFISIHDTKILQFIRFELGEMI
ncbi:translation elongation factor Ts [Buchnera aphidicola (Takecallis taiwana)]|uniref:translation elongation factor Ts n=1 Tax=Buchnera aphidicola TaxID=9 RepID=UPI0031B86422